MNTGKQIRNIRTELGISQEDLAELVKVSRQTVSKWENGLGSPSADNLSQLSRALDVPVDALLHEDWTPPDIQVVEITDSRPGGRRLWLPLAALVLAVGIMVGALLLWDRPWNVVSASELESEVIDPSTVGGNVSLDPP